MEELYLTSASSAGAEIRVDALVREYQTRLVRYVRRMVGDSEVALDLTQDVFFAAYRTLQKDPERPMTPGWLYKTATNSAISYLRRKKILRMIPLDRDSHDRSWRIDEQSAASIDLQAAIAKLPAEQASAVLLTSYAGYSSGEAAEMLGTSADAVRQRVCRAMKLLRTVMTEQT
jgi:RNA polymerase sigma factor (sigma-70 family)